MLDDTRVILAILGIGVIFALIGTFWALARVQRRRRHRRSLSWYYD